MTDALESMKAMKLVDKVSEYDLLERTDGMSEFEIATAQATEAAIKPPRSAHERLGAGIGSAYRQLTVIQDLFDSGGLSGCFAAPAIMGQGWNLYFTLKTPRGALCALASKRVKSEPKSFKSSDSLLATAFKIGFQDVGFKKR